MDRRSFLSMSGGMLAAGLWSCQAPTRRRQAFEFASAAEGRCEVPVTRVTPDDGGIYVFTYYDISPWSPSGRYLVTTRLPFQDRWPTPSDAADVCVIDLRDRTIETVYRTRSWGFQLGSNVQWGASDRVLYTNDIVDGRAVCVRIDVETGQTKAFAGPLVHLAPDESCAIGFPLELMNVTQRGYGTASADWDNPDKLPPGAARDQGLWRTDLRTGERRLLLSLADAAARVPAPAPRESGTFYFWHSRFNRRGDRILQVARCLFPDRTGGMNAMVFTLKPDGSDLRYTPAWTAPGDPVWSVQGGHPNWHPDGEHIVRHLGSPQRFCRIRADGSRFDVLSERLVATGHPSAEPSGRYLITDRFDDQGGRTNVALRLIDLKRDEDRDLCVLPSISRKSIPDPMFRLDGHPVWSRDHRQVCLQATSRGNRAIYVADLSGAI